MDESNTVYKKPGKKDSYDVQKVNHLKKCIYDPLYFIDNFVRVQHATQGALPFKIYDYQKEILESFIYNQHTICMAGRQLGKCLNYSTYLELRSPEGKEIKITVGEFYEWLKFRQYAENILSKE